MIDIFSGRGIWFAITFTVGVTLASTMLDPVADNIEGWASSLVHRNGNGNGV